MYRTTSDHIVSVSRCFTHKSWFVIFPHILHLTTSYVISFRISALHGTSTIEVGPSAELNGGPWNWTCGSLSNCSARSCLSSSHRIIAEEIGVQEWSGWLRAMWLSSLMRLLITHSLSNSKRSFGFIGRPQLEQAQLEAVSESAMACETKHKGRSDQVPTTCWAQFEGYQIVQHPSYKGTIRWYRIMSKIVT